MKAITLALLVFLVLTSGNAQNRFSLSGNNYYGLSVAESEEQIHQSHLIGVGVTGFFSVYRGKLLSYELGIGCQYEGLNMLDYGIVFNEDFNGHHIDLKASYFRSENVQVFVSPAVRIAYESENKSYFGTLEYHLRKAVYSDKQYYLRESRLPLVRTIQGSSNDVEVSCTSMQLMHRSGWLLVNRPTFGLSIGALAGIELFNRVGESIRLEREFNSTILYAGIYVSAHFP